MTAFVIDPDPAPPSRTFLVQKDDPIGDDPSINVLLAADIGFFLEAFEFGILQAEQAADEFHTLLHVTIPAPGYWR